MKAVSVCTVVVPFYNEHRRIESFLSAVPRDKFLDCRWVFVDDGSSENSYQKCAHLIGRYLPEAKIIRNVINRGKGHALAVGFHDCVSNVDSRTSLWAFVDADASTSFVSLRHMIDFAVASPATSLVLGSRVKMLGRQIYRSEVRHYIGRFFATFLSVLFRIPVYDSQCGAKVYRTEDLSQVVGQITDTRWTWDTQSVVLLYNAGKNLVEFPVDWKEVPGSKISLMRDCFKMAWALIRFRQKMS